MNDRTKSNTIILGERYISRTDAAGDYHFATPKDFTSSHIGAVNETSGCYFSMTFREWLDKYTHCPE